MEKQPVPPAISRKSISPMAARPVRPWEWANAILPQSLMPLPLSAFLGCKESDNIASQALKPLEDLAEHVTNRLMTEWWKRNTARPMSSFWSASRLEFKNQ